MRILLALLFTLTSYLLSYSQTVSKNILLPQVIDTGMTSSDYINYIESTIHELTVIRSSARMGFKVISISNDMPETDTTIKVMRESLVYGAHLDVRDLQMFEMLIKDLQKKLNANKKDLDSANLRIHKAFERMAVLQKDSTWYAFQKDAEARQAFTPQLIELKNKFRTTDSTMRKHAQVVESLSIHVANNAILNSEMLDKIDNQIRKLSQQSFKKEQNYLWEKNISESSKEEVKLAAKKYYRAERETVWFYVRESSIVRVWMLVVGVFFFLWVRKNFKKLDDRDRNNALKGIDLRYVDKNLVAATILVVLSLSPLFDLTPPAVYITFMQFLLMIVQTYLYFKRWPKVVFTKWATIVLLYFLMASTHLISSASIWVRYWFFFLTIGSIVFGVLFLREQVKTKEFPKYVQWVTVFYILFNFLSCIFNLFGRWTLTQLFGFSAVFGLAQIIGLTTFIKILMEAFTLNIQTARVVNGLQQENAPRSFIENLERAVTTLSIVLWIMVLASNLNIYNFLYDLTLRVLTTPRTIGNVSFNIGSILLFFLIIWVSGILQKYISYLFGDASEEISKVNKRQHSKLLILRLILLTAGFFLAVAASGLPVDKITIIIGALGVGIGLGLQNIVNNFVSGVILIFERPFQVGDSIEIGARKGRVKEIGIRHSILLTPEGGEVIVPNGDMLSNQILNWTLSNNYMRIEIPLKIETNENWQTVSEIVEKVVESDDRVLPTREPLILLNNLSNNIVDFKVLVWCKDFYFAEKLKSDLVQQLSAHFKARDIQIK